MSSNGGSGIGRESERWARRWGLPVVAVAMIAGLVVLPGATASAASVVRINAGGSAQTVDGISWSGCTAASSCGGYVSGGNAWSESTGAIGGVVSPDSQAIERSEWTGGSQNGVPSGGTAFTFSIPVEAGQYDVKLHFTELNKSAAGQRVFDVVLNGSTVLPNYDIFKDVGKLVTTTKTFRASPVNGKITVGFVRRIENAKVSAIEVLPAGSSSTTTTATPTTATTVPAPATTTTVPPSGGTGGTTIAWSGIANSPQRSVEAAGGMLGDKLYTFGGYLPGSWTPSNGAYAYSTTGNSWERLPNVPRGLTHAARAVDGRSFIIAGGYGAANGGGQVFAVNNVYRYNVDSKTWSNLPNLPAARGSGSMAVIGRTLHFLGGVDANRVEKGEHWTLDLDNVSNGWQSAPAFPWPRTHFASVAVGQYLYAVGGLWGIDERSTELNGVYRYDTVAKTWAQQSTMPVALSHISDSTFAYDGRIWVLGGEDRFAHGTNTVWVFDPAAKAWKQATNLPAGRFSGVAGVVGSTFYFATGDLGSNIAWKGAVR